MCYNFETSISTFIFALISSIYLWNRNKTDDRWFCMFGLTFSSMQLIEALLHRDLKNRNLNTILSLAGFIIVFLEPLANNAGGIFYGNDKSFFIKSTLMYLIYMLYIYTFKYPETKDFQTTKEPNLDNLQWNWLNKLNTLDWIVYLFFISMPCLFYKNEYKSMFCFFTGLAAYLYACFYAGFKQPGSLWCLLVNVIYIGVILLN